MAGNRVINWLLEDDVSIQYQVYRDLLATKRPDLRKRISEEGWGRLILSKRMPGGHWGRSFYQPKWTSSHYTLLELKNLAIEPDIPEISETIQIILRNEKHFDGGVNPGKKSENCDVCINGMFLNYASYFGAPQEELKSVVEFLIGQQMKDGGFNCHLNRKGAVHSSLHTTISVLEGIQEYARSGYFFRLNDLQQIAAESTEFILQHQLYKSDKTGEVINERMTRFSFPCRWYYDVLRALDYFQDAGLKYDARMDDALSQLLKKQNSDGTWNLQAPHPGLANVEMEVPGKASRWNTLRAMRVLKHFDEFGPNQIISA